MSSRMNPRFAKLTALAAIAAFSFAGQLPAADEKASDVPLTRVVLFSSGVGFYEHNGKVEGDSHVDLRFNVEDINDLLKSMVLQDFGGGRISTVNYGSKDPITKALKTFAIDLTSNPTLADLLKQIRGEKVQVDAPTAITGTIVGVEKRKVKVGKEEVIEQEFLNILTDQGLRSVGLETVSRIRLLDDKLNGELQQALQILSSSHDTDKKTVTLNFLGQGKRDVKVGYIQESPIWKTSYRLVLKDDEKPFLQGWAIVENTTEQDWNDVNLTLVSGRPISFIMDLYQPLYVQRPEVKPELYASLKPQTYDQDLANKEAEFRAAGERSEEKLAAKSEAPRNARFSMDGAARGRGFGGGFGGGGLGGGLAAPAAAAPATQAFDPTQGVQSLAQAGDVGELFQYVIATPVKLPRQQSAMLPIVNESVEGSKVSIYNQNVQAKHPLNGLRLKNTTKLHLMQGPVTVFDGGAYAGDARIEDLQPGTERLVSYALDLDTEVCAREQGSSGAVSEREDCQRHTVDSAEAHSRNQVHREKLGRAGQNGAGGISAGCELEAGHAQGAVGKDTGAVPIQGGRQAGKTVGLECRGRTDCLAELRPDKS